MTGDLARERTEPSDAIWTIPNVLTFIRLAIVPAFLYVSLGLERLDIGVSLAFFGVITDLADGKIARHFGTISKLGIRLDPLADRLGVISAVIVLLVHDALAPAWLLLAVLARDLLLVAVGVPVLRARGVAIPEVSRLGKFASFWTSAAMGLFLASGWFAVDDPIRGVQVAGWVVSAFAIPAYWVAAFGYARAAFGPSADARGD